MKNTVCLIAFLLFQICLSQVQFESGYLIDNTGNKKNVLIKNFGWQNNPSFINVKDENDSKELIKKIEDLKEFGFDDGTIYKRFTLDISDYKDDLSKIDSDSKFKPENKTVFLKLLSAGKVNLFSYVDGTNKFFYNEGEETPKQLYYKRFYNEKDDLQTIRLYRDQLKNIVSCSNLDYSKVEYNTKSLKAIFDTFNNNCEKPKVTSTTKSKLAVNLLLEVYSMSTSATSQYYYLESFSMDGKLTPKFGVEFEYFLPFNKQTFSIVVGAKYHSYKNEFIREYDVYPHTQKINLNASTLEFPIGFRYYNYLNTDNALFFSFSYVLKNALKASYTINERDYELKYGGVLDFNIGVGYKYKKVMAELVYDTGSFRSAGTLEKIKNSGVGLSVKYNVF